MRVMCHDYAVRALHCPPPTRSKFRMTSIQAVDGAMFPGQVSLVAAGTHTQRSAVGAPDTSAMRLPTRAVVSRSQMWAASCVCTGCHHIASRSGTAS